MPVPAFLMSPAGQALLSAGITYGVKGIQDWWRGPRQPDQIRQYLEQQYMQAPQTNFNDIANEEQRRYRQDILPNILEQIAAGGAGGQHSGAYFMQPQQAAMDLNTRLARLRGEFQNQQETQRLNRLSGLRGLREGQQVYDLTRARQRQAGAGARARMMQGILGGLQGLGDREAQERQQRRDQIGQLYTGTVPRYGNIYHNPTEGFGMGYMRGAGNLARNQAIMDQYRENMASKSGAPTS